MIFNDLFCLSHPEVHTLSIGASKPSDFDAHVEAVELFDRVGEMLPPIVKRLDAEIEKLLGPVWPTRWAEGLADWSEFPEGTNVREIVRLWILAKAFDMTQHARERYNLFGEGGHWFAGSKFGSAGMDTILSKIPATSPIREKIPGILREAHSLFEGEQKKRLSKSG
jgi:predicted aldo/keto reductase-like oxidoreductase